MTKSNDPAITLRIRRGREGQWFGRLFVAEKELVILEACASVRAVEEMAEKIGFHPERVEVETS